MKRLSIFLYGVVCYENYRRRVPMLIPFLKRRQSSGRVAVGG